MVNLLEQWPYRPPREDPQQPLADIRRPPGYLLVPEAVDVAGAGMFGDEWTGKELSARAVSVPPPGSGGVGEQFEPGVRHIPGVASVESGGFQVWHRPSHSSHWRVLTSQGERRVGSNDEARALWDSERPKLFEMWRTEYGARDRCEEVIRGLEDALYDKAFQAQGHRLEFGDLFPIKSDFWGSNKVGLVWRNPTPILFPVDSGRFSGRFIKGRVLFRAADIEAYVSGKTDDKTTVDQKAATAGKMGRPKGLAGAARSRGGKKSRHNPWLQEAMVRIVAMLEADGTPLTFPAVWKWLCDNAPPGEPHAFEPPIPGCDFLYVEDDKLSFRDQEGNHHIRTRRSLERYMPKSKGASG